MREKCEVDDPRGAIENAHRDGPRKFGQSRHIIARFYSRVNRNMVLKDARTKLAGESYYIKENPTIQDRQEKIKCRRLLQRLYDAGRRPIFRQVVCICMSLVAHVSKQSIKNKMKGE